MANFIGNIITTRRTKYDPIFNRCQSVKSSVNGIPTLIVGWDMVKSIYPNVNILKKQIDDMTYWTFDRMDMGAQYEDDLKLFYRFCIDNVFKSIPFYHISPFTITYTNAKKTLEVFRSPLKKYIYVHKEKYVYCYMKSVFFGISLEDTLTMNLNKQRILEILIKNPNHIIRFDDRFISYEIRRIIRNKIRIIPYLMSISL